jgi:FRG domain
MAESRNRVLFEQAAKYRKTLTGHNGFTEEIESYKFEGAPCVFAHTYRALVRTVGYFKYNAKTQILMRGQTNCHLSMKSSLHRRATPPSDRAVEDFLSRYRNFLNVDQDAATRLSTEPMLQHYGIETRWLDAVDSIPHALFFATHRPVPPAPGATEWSYAPSYRKHGFIYLFDTGRQRVVRRSKSILRGYSRGDGLLVADLRELKPSLALRPHAQHGLLIRDTSGQTDLWNRLVARIAIPADVARRWILGKAFEPPTFFPARAWDRVYGHLLSDKMNRFLADETSQGNSWGQIQRFDFHLDT